MKIGLGGETIVVVVPALNVIDASYFWLALKLKLASRLLDGVELVDCSSVILALGGWWFDCWEVLVGGRPVVN